MARDCVINEWFCRTVFFFFLCVYRRRIEFSNSFLSYIGSGRFDRRLVHMYGWLSKVTIVMQESPDKCYFASDNQ